MRFPALSKELEAKGRCFGTSVISERMEYPHRCFNLSPALIRTSLGKGDTDNRKKRNFSGGSVESCGPDDSR